MSDTYIKMLHEANDAFGNHTAHQPTVPAIDSTGRGVLMEYVKRLGIVAEGLKQEAKECKAFGEDNLALIFLRLQLSVEEITEWAEALASGDIVRAFSELLDMDYVTQGHYLMLGVDAHKARAFRALHDANMSKLGEDGQPIINAAGRWVKGPNYKAPDIAAILSQK